MNQYSNEICLETLLFKISMKNQNTSTEEDYISYHMSQFIGDEKMTNLPITCLDRILLKYFKIKDGIEKVDEEEIVNFLFSFLDSAGRKASVLFGHLDFGENKLEIIQRLVKGYSDVFDFNMLNSTLAKTVTELTSEMIKQSENFKIIFDQMKKK